ncbi:unnamed protein product [Pieris brassicae]|uniref:Uncharacterized protein n=1 Tax=Pieris brassicae TaxID=7116 RepID=A0A9P0X3P4_PIEBR|nr:unnamed protein product [Pieris brassicae]
MGNLNASNLEKNYQGFKLAKGTGLVVLVGLILSAHSRPLSHYCPIRGLLAAGFPLWPGSPLLNEPAPPRLLRGVHINTRLSVDVQSTWTTQHQEPQPQTILCTRPPSSRITGDATLPVESVDEILKQVPNI